MMMVGFGFGASFVALFMQVRLMHLSAPIAGSGHVLTNWIHTDLHTTDSWVAASTRRRPTWELTWWERSSREFLKTTRATRP